LESIADKYLCTDYPEKRNRENKRLLLSGYFNIFLIKIKLNGRGIFTWIVPEEQQRSDQANFRV
jgi:hypothetical protein